MNKINEHNRDEWFFEYHEGELPINQKIEVEQFVSAHPEYEREFLAWGQATIHDDGIRFEGADELVQKEQSTHYKWLLLLLIPALGVIGYLTNRQPIKPNEIASTHQQSNPKSTIESEIQNNSVPINELKNNSTPEEVQESMPKTIESQLDNQVILNTVDNNSVETALPHSIPPHLLASLQIPSTQSTQEVPATAVIEQIDESQSVDLGELLTNHQNDENLVIYTPENIGIEELVAPVELEESDNKQNTEIISPPLNNTNSFVIASDSSGSSSLVEESLIGEQCNCKKKNRFRHKRPKKEPHIIVQNQFNVDFVIPGMNPTEFSPSYAGNRNKFNFEGYQHGYKRGEDLNSISRHMNVSSFSIDGYVNKFRGGVGIRIHSEETANRNYIALLKAENPYQFGQYKSRKTSFYYSPKIKPTSKIIIEPGIAYNLLHYEFHAKGAVLASDVDVPYVQFANDSVSEFSSDMYTSGDVGLQIHTPELNIGVSLSNIHANWFSVNTSYSVHEKTLFKANAGTYVRFDPLSKWTWNPSVFYIQQPNSKDFWFANSFGLALGKSGHLYFRGAYNFNRSFAGGTALELGGVQFNYKYGKMNVTYSDQQQHVHQVGMNIKM